MKVGIELKIDVTKIDKARLYKGNKGTYLTVTSFVDLDQADQYNNNGMVTHKKQEGEERAPILGNAKVFWRDETHFHSPPEQFTPPHIPHQFEDESEDIPF